MVSDGGNESNWRAYFKAVRARLWPSKTTIIFVETCLLLLAALIFFAPALMPSPPQNPTAGYYNSKNNYHHNFSVLQVYLQLFFGLGGWARRHHDAIEASAAFGGLVLSFVLSVSNYLLWVETRNAARAGRKQARLIRKSIKLASKEFIATHRPKIRIKHVWPVDRAWANAPIAANLVIVNKGSANAIITEVKYAFVILPIADNLPGSILTPGNNIGIVVQSVNGFGIEPIENGVTHLIQGLVDRRNLNPGEALSIRNRSVRLYFIGSVEYQNAERTILRTTGFCRVLIVPLSAGLRSSTDVGRYEVVEDSDYEYAD
jgi:hypothetical protein